MKDRTRTEYRVQVQRTGNAVSDKRFYSLAAVQRRIGLLTSPEPWKFYDRYAATKGPNDYVCCAGTVYDECGCGGVTYQQQTDEKRRDLPPIEWIRVSVRRVTRTPWEPLDVATSMNAGATPLEEGATESAHRGDV